MRRTTGVDSSVSFIWQANEKSLAAAFSVQYQRLEPIKHVGPGVCKLMSSGKHCPSKLSVWSVDCNFPIIWFLSFSFPSDHCDHLQWWAEHKSWKQNDLCCISEPPEGFSVSWVYAFSFILSPYFSLRHVKADVSERRDETTRTRQIPGYTTL